MYVATALLTHVLPDRHAAIRTALHVARYDRVGSRRDAGRTCMKNEFTRRAGRLRRGTCGRSRFLARTDESVLVGTDVEVIKPTASDHGKSRDNVTSQVRDYRGGV